MASFKPFHRGVLIQGSTIAEHIITKETRLSVSNLYDIKTFTEFDSDERQDGVFAKLMLLESPEKKTMPHYRVCLQDQEIFDFLGKNSDIDILSFFTFIMTHELLHVHRFNTGKADYYFQNHHEEEVFVDSLTRLFLVKHPITGLKNIITLLDKVEAAPLYNVKIMKDEGKSIYAHL